MPQTRRQRGGVRSKSLFKRGPSLLNKALQRRPVTHKKGKLNASRQALLNITSPYLAKRASGKAVNPFPVLLHLSALLERLPRDATEPILDAVVADLPELLAPYLDIPTISRFYSKYLSDETNNEGYSGNTEGASKPNRNPVYVLIKDLHSTYETAKLRGGLKGYLATARPIELANEVLQLLLHTIKQKGLFQRLAPQEQTHSMNEVEEEPLSAEEKELLELLKSMGI